MKDSSLLPLTGSDQPNVYSPKHVKALSPDRVIFGPKSIHASIGMVHHVLVLPGFVMNGTSDWRDLGGERPKVEQVSIARYAKFALPCKKCIPARTEGEDK